jgi:hypothetical protein
VGIYEIKKPKKINAFSVSIFLVAATVVYLLYVFIPAWWPVFQETGIMKGVCNDAYRQYADEILIQKLLKESVRTKLGLTKDNFVLERVQYTEEEMSTMGLTEDQKILYRKRGKECRLTLNYTSTLLFPGISKTMPLTWSRTISTDLAVVQY